VVLTASTFFVFLAIVFFLHWTVAPWRILRLTVLLFANYFFLARFGLWYLLLIPAAGTLDFLAGLALEPAQSSFSAALDPGLQRGHEPGHYAGGALCGQGAVHLHAGALVLRLSGAHLHHRRLSARRPGHFQLLEHLTAVSLFPTPLAGPITRVGDLQAQFARKPALSNEQAGRALFLISLGLVKKLLIADYLANNLVNRVFDLPNLYSGFEVLAASTATRCNSTTIFRLHGYRHRRGAPGGLEPAPELRPALFLAQHPGILGALAHQFLAVVARLSVFLAARPALEATRCSRMGTW